MADQPLGMLALQDGTTFMGRSWGAEGEWVGEVVFNTSMTGYQEIMTDPSYYGQMVCFTCPHIGNVGVNLEDVESRQPYVRAVLARQICAQPSNWRSQQPLPAYLRQHGIPALDGLDTRRLTLILRTQGVLKAALSTVNLDASRLIEMARQAPDMSAVAVVPQVAPPTELTWDEAVPGPWRSMPGVALSSSRRSPHVVVLDCGVKWNILRNLRRFGARVTVVPYSYTLDAVLAAHPDGVLLGNGPGDPEQVPAATIQTIQGLLGKAPIFGLCLGHQLLALAVGARTYKLRFGHHGGNQPVQDLATGAIAITAQNHNYAVDETSLQGLPLEVTHRNLNDHTIEGMRHTRLPIVSVQYHPEASPGPHDALYLLRAFVQSLEP